MRRCIDWSDRAAVREYERQWRAEKLAANPQLYRFKQRVKRKKYRAARLTARRAWIARNREKTRSYNRAWKLRNPEAYRQSVARRRARQMAKPQGRIHKAMRDGIRHAMKGSGTTKTLRTMAIVGCSIDALKVHLERQFKRGMTWSNYGKLWQIDHITPVSYFDLTEPTQLALCFNWQNLRPLFAKKNRSDGNRRGDSQLHLPLTN